MSLAAWHWRSLKMTGDQNGFLVLVDQETERPERFREGLGVDSMQEGTFGNHVKQAAPQSLKCPSLLPQATAKDRIHSDFICNWCLIFPLSWCDINCLFLDALIFPIFLKNIGTMISMVKHVDFYSLLNSFYNVNSRKQDRWLQGGGHFHNPWWVLTNGFSVGSHLSPVIPDTWMVCDGCVGFVTFPTMGFIILPLPPTPK